MEAIALLCASRVLGIFKLTLFPPLPSPSKELHFEKQQNKMKQKSVWLLGVGVWGFGACRDEFANLPK